MAILKKRESVESEGESGENETERMLRDVIDKEMQRDEVGESEDETKSVKKPAEVLEKPVLHTGEAGIDGDEVDYSTLKKVVDMAIKPVSFVEKLRVYYLYVVIFGIVTAMIIAAFWDAFMVRGTMTWQLGFVIALPLVIGVYYWAVEVREKVDKRYPIWFDINSRYYFNFAEVGDKDGYLLIMPFKVYKQRVYKPDNPFKTGAPFLIAIDTKCIHKNEAGMVTIGRLNYDMTPRATFSVEYDTDYIPNPDINNLLFELNITKSSLKHSRELRIEADLKYRDMRKVKFDDEFDTLMKHIRMLLPVLSLMLRSKEHDVISDIAMMDKLGEAGFNVKGYNKGQRDELLEALKRG